MTSIDLAPAARQRPLATLAQSLVGFGSTDRLLWIVIALVWILGHSYIGIEHDARIYMGRALADLDPNGIGRDMMFALDGQSSFTAFRLLARASVAAFGLGPATAMLTLINLIVWLAAITVLVRTIVPGRPALLVLLVVLLLPRFYSPWHLFTTGESVPTPRPLAEAGVLFAMAALWRDRVLLALACLGAATIFHPIMAAPGFGVLLAVLARRDWRWLAAAAIGACALVAVAMVGAPVASRLLTGIDPTWHEILFTRNFYLWIQQWPPEIYGRVAVQAVTILIACAFLDKRSVFLMGAALLTGILGIIASLAFADGLSNLLFLQAQLWRAFWLPALLAPVAAGILAWRLPACGRGGQIVLALMAVAWIAMDWLPMAPLAAAGALAFFLIDRRRPLAIDNRVMVAIFVTCGLMAIVVEAVPLSALIELYSSKPTGAKFPMAMVWSSGVMTPAVMLVVAWWHWQKTTAGRVALRVTVVALAALVATTWDSRPSIQSATDSGRPVSDLRDMMASRAGEVLWLQRDEVWTWVGRPNWTGVTQGSGIVFSRDLAMKWKSRGSVLVEHGLAHPDFLAPWRGQDPLDPIDLAKADLTGFCARQDAPAWIVAPIEAGRAVPNVPGTRTWTPASPSWGLTTAPGSFRWATYDRYAVIPCARDAKAI